MPAKWGTLSGWGLLVLNLFLLLPSWELHSHILHHSQHPSRRLPWALLFCTCWPPSPEAALSKYLSPPHLIPPLGKPQPSSMPPPLGHLPQRPGGSDSASFPEPHIPLNPILPLPLADAYKCVLLFHFWVCLPQWTACRQGWGVSACLPPNGHNPLLFSPRQQLLVESLAVSREGPGRMVRVTTAGMGSSGERGGEPLRSAASC